MGLSMKFLFIFFLSFQSSFSYSFNRRIFLENAIGTTSIIKNSNSNTILEVSEKNMNDESPGELGIIQDIDNKIYFYGPVSQRSCFELRNKLTELETRSQTFKLQYDIMPPPIHLHIQSQGGSLYHTLYIVDLIQKLKTPVYTYIDGFSASAATLISVVGEKRYMTKNSLMLIHQLSGADSGKFNELQDQMTNMNILMKIIRTIYLNNTHLDIDTLNILLQKDLWLESDVCLEYGLIDEII